ncbi:probable 2-oxoglutarate-dependent dioxygenase AOP1.2 [Juglans microcarpa x Juglans regia]|uniref:probable 2-oxoglutarate-dependent dioxygenase AOP1.2 n=1 Tax=Juglans microcarpa x Juglans regia TaxID=2249226 RepID=UPI001B7D9380|nr:probable 2-oxoglutarate-dependent dioxygenase AOP1.2 [Juglans microcarpa x Juglans regia]
MMKLLDELSHLIGTMILDGYGLGEKLESIMECETLLRIMRCETNSTSGESVKGLAAHTDKVLFTFLCEDQVSGLEVETKDGQWIKLSPSPTSFIFIVGDLLKAWSNCRMHAVNHRVMMTGDKERYSFGVFAVPMDASNIKAPKQLVDEEHPQVLKEFRYKDYLDFTYSEKARSIDYHMHMLAFAGM